jgi:hypothetical protein
VRAHMLQLSVAACAPRRKHKGTAPKAHRHVYVLVITVVVCECVV